MASSVAAPLERQFGQLADVTQMTSLSALGATTIAIQFDLGRNIDSAAEDVQAAINAAGRTLPQSMTTPPTYRKLNPAETPILILSVRSDTLPLITRRRLCRNFLAQQISEVPGVAQVTILGEPKAGDPRPGHPASSPPRPDARGRPSGARQCRTTNAAKGALNTAHDLHDRRQRPDHRARAVRRCDHRLSQRRAGQGARYRACRLRAADRGAAAFPNNRPGLLLSVSQAAGRQRHRNGGPD